MPTHARTYPYLADARETKERLRKLGYADGVHPYQIIKTDMDGFMSRLCCELINMANKRHDLPYWHPKIEITLKDREGLRQACEDYIQEYLNDAIPWYHSDEGKARAEHHAKMMKRGLENREKPTVEETKDITDGLSDSDKAKLLEHLLKGTK